MTKKDNGLFKQAVRVFFGRGILVKISLVIIVLFLFAALFAPVLTPYTDTEQHLKDKLKAPSSTYLLGTDYIGRDLLTRLLYGARVSLVCSVLSSLIAASVGILLGMIAGYYGKWFGSFIMRVTDAQLSMPPLVLCMVLAAVFGGGIFGVSIVIGITIMPGYVRMIYGQVLGLRENDFIIASRLVGQNGRKILFKHLLPNCFPTIIVMFTMNLGTAIMLEASLSFLGIGITAPTPAWGSMVSEGYNYLIRRPNLALYPGICVLLVVIAFNIVGDAVRDAIDPRLRGKL